MRKHLAGRRHQVLRPSLNDDRPSSRLVASPIDNQRSITSNREDDENNSPSSRQGSSFHRIIQFMSSTLEREDVPEFLKSFENLTAHFDEHFGERGSNARGDTFLALAQKVIPLTDEFSAFPPPTVNEKKSHDGGVDLLTGETSDGRILFVQSKYKIRDKAAFDTIISKFKDFESCRLPPKPQPDLIPPPEEQTLRAPVTVFAVVTSSKQDGIISKYTASTLASRPYYEKLVSESRLKIIDGPQILTLLQQLYRKSHLIPANVTLESPHGWLNAGEVYIGAIDGKALADLFTRHGDALFFENIRDFLGASSGRVVKTRSTVNQEIINTISHEPDRLLFRNNGITLRAHKAKPDGRHKLDLTKAAIVNGCQTTMCLVHCGPAQNTCFVPVKVVVTEDAWDIAKSANYQNPVARIDLDLARYLRPQLVRRVATTLGYAVETNSESSASAVLNSIYQHKIDYDELRLLYLGLFSRKPNNVFEANYTELREDVLQALYREAASEEQIFTVILMLLKESRTALDTCQKTFAREEYASLFKRFYKEEKPQYRSFLAVAAACSAVREDVSSRVPACEEETQRMRIFLGKCRSLLENHPDKYHAAYKHAFVAVADSLLDVDTGKNESDIQQNMFHKVSTMAFDSLYKRILVRIDADD